MDQEQQKHVDESWKEAVAKEKERQGKEGTFVPPDPDFSFFVTTLALQASISLGVVANPGTNQKEENLAQAKFMIDTLSLLQEKTKGNLTEDEGKLLENILYELRMQFIEKSKKGDLNAR